MRIIPILLAFTALTATVQSAERPPAPTRHSMEGCTWAWKAGAGIGFWAEDCDLDTGKWRIEYDAARQRFVQMVDGKNPMPVITLFDLPQDVGVDFLLPQLRKGGLIKDTDECVFAPDEENTPGAERRLYQVVPKGKLLDAFNKLPGDEVPEPPCGELGLLPDAVGYFMTDAKLPGRVLYLMLGQDQPLFEPDSITSE